MRPAEELEKLVKRLRYEPSAEAHNRVLRTVLGALDQSREGKTAGIRPAMWRITMRSGTGKLAAAVIAVLVVGGVMFWPGGSGNGKWWLGPPAAWSREVLAALDTVRGVACREQTIFVMSDGSHHTSGTWDMFYVSSDSYRRDIYDDDTLREIQWYVPDGNDMVQHYVRLDLECYGDTRHKGSFGFRDPVDRIRFYVNLLDDADSYLGEEIIEDRDCVGFEISASKYGTNPEAWVERIWFDVKTRLPVMIERDRPCPRDETQTDYQPHITILDQFDYDPQLPGDTFIPVVPEDFVNAHPDEIQASREKERKE